MLTISGCEQGGLPEILFSETLKAEAKTYKVDVNMVLSQLTVSLTRPKPPAAVSAAAASNGSPIKTPAKSPYVPASLYETPPGLVGYVQTSEDADGTFVATPVKPAGVYVCKIVCECVCVCVCVCVCAFACVHPFIERQLMETCY